MPKVAPNCGLLFDPDHAGPPLQLFTAKGFEWVDAQLPIPGLPGELDGF